MYLYPKGYDETSEGQIHKQIKIHAKKKTYSAEFYPICCTSVQIAIIRFKKK